MKQFEHPVRLNGSELGSGFLKVGIIPQYSRLTIHGHPNSRIFQEATINFLLLGRIILVHTWQALPGLAVDKYVQGIFDEQREMMERKRVPSALIVQKVFASWPWP
jgi:hypothetical protein